MGVRGGMHGGGCIEVTGGRRVCGRKSSQIEGMGRGILGRSTMTRR